MLIALSGLPGVGKTTIARLLAAELGAVLVRIDAIEAAMKRSVLKIHPAEDAGYRVGMAVAEDNLALGLTVVADAVNPVAETRRWWADIAARSHVPILNVEVVCPDTQEHRKRVGTPDQRHSGAVASGLGRRATPEV